MPCARFVALLLVLLWGVAGSCLADDASLGREIYQDHCEQCHGKGMASPGLAFDLRKFPLNDPQRFQQAVLNGTEKGMPAWKAQLSAEDVKALWDYVKSGG